MAKRVESVRRVFSCLSSMPELSTIDDDFIQPRLARDAVESVKVIPPTVIHLNRRVNTEYATGDRTLNIFAAPQIEEKAMGMRIGFGTDLHRLTHGDGLKIGGVTIPCPYRTEARSDGDVLLHALVDALLGTCGGGDIGDHFPENEVPQGQDSALFVTRTLEMTAAAGLKVANVDCVVDLETVKLGAWKTTIRKNVAALLGLPENRVNVKAKTAEGVGPVGEGKALAAQVAVLAEET